MKERELQSEIMRLLRLSRYVVFKFSSVGIYKKATDRYIPQGRRGISDLIACQPKTGRLVAIEVKTPEGVVSWEQQQFIDEVNAAGGIAFVARSIDDVQAALGIKG